MRPHIVLCGFITLFYGFATVKPVQANAPDWGLVPTIEDAPKSPVAPPPGCECMDSQCVKFDCSCTCNLIAHQCDMNCCCDSEVCTYDNGNICMRKL